MSHLFLSLVNDAITRSSTLCSIRGVSTYPEFIQLYVPIEIRLYHHPGRMLPASTHLGVLPFGIVVALSLHEGLAQDYPVWASPEFKEFAISITVYRR